MTMSDVGVWEEYRVQEAYSNGRKAERAEQPSVWLAAGVAVHRELEAINLKRWEQQQ